MNVVFTHFREILGSLCTVLRTPFLEVHAHAQELKSCSRNCYYSYGLLSYSTNQVVKRHCQKLEKFCEQTDKSRDLKGKDKNAAPALDSKMQQQLKQQQLDCLLEASYDHASRQDQFGALVLHRCVRTSLGSLNCEQKHCYPPCSAGH